MHPIYIGFRRRPGALFREWSTDQDIPSLPVLSYIRSGEKLSLHTMRNCLPLLGLLDRLHDLSFSGLHSFLKKLGQDSRWALCGHGHVLQMEWNMQFGS